MTVTDAIRKRIPILAAIYGPTGGGKTFSGLLLAAGLAGPDGVVGMIDTEARRGSLYSDDPDICAAMPGGHYKVLDLSAPYSPSRYIEALTAMEKAGVTVCLIDSTSHEWSGTDGACEIAEKNKLGGMANWAKAKIEHKKFVNYCLSSRMSIFFLLRAHEKMKPVKAGDLISNDGQERYEKTEFIPLGTVADTEKNLVFEALISFRLDADTHLANPVKVPKMLAHVFPGKKLLSKADGEAIRIWNERAPQADQWEQTRKRARAAAEEGVTAYKAFCASLNTPAKKAMGKALYDELLARATEADAINAAQQDEDTGEPPPEVQADTGSETVPEAAAPLVTPGAPVGAEPPSTETTPDAPPIAPEAAQEREASNGGTRPPTMDELRRQMEAAKAHPRGRKE